MAEYKHFEFERLLAVAGVVCSLIGFGLGAPSAMARFVCDVTGCALDQSLAPTLAIPAFVFGAVGATLGFIGRRRPPLEDTQSPFVHWALWAVILGSVAVGLATIGLVAK
ncbi:MAG: hypothetical protein QOD01_2980 [Actinomycetota bacterium]|jgi:hypothetical protein|nr:hypothetical protein [Actinomycetota bacterium]